MLDTDLGMADGVFLLWSESLCAVSCYCVYSMYLRMNAEMDGLD